MNKEERAAFREGKPVEVITSSDVYTFLEAASQFFPQLRWGGEERLNFRPFLIRKENYPIYLWKEDNSLWWIPKSEIKEEE